MGPADVLQSYFAETMGGDMTAVDRHFAESPECVLIVEDDRELRKRLLWVGRQTDREGIKRA